MQLKNIFEKSEDQNESCFPKLSWTQRIVGFAICCILGYVISFLSIGAFLSLATGNPAKFGIMFCLGNSLSLAATGFLLGFKRQCQNMAKPERKITTIVFFCAFFGTLISAIVIQSKLLVILCLCVQVPAYIWYCASYIPFARDCIKSCLRGAKAKITRQS